MPMMFTVVEAMRQWMGPHNHPPLSSHDEMMRRKKVTVLDSSLSQQTTTTTPTAVSGTTKVQAVATKVRTKMFHFLLVFFAMNPVLSYRVNLFLLLLFFVGAVVIIADLCL
jgi:hypothetical protein